MRTLILFGGLPPVQERNLVECLQEIAKLVFAAEEELSQHGSGLGWVKVGQTAGIGGMFALHLGPYLEPSRTSSGSAVWTPAICIRHLAFEAAVS
jgi:hypothetical protein